MNTKVIEGVYAAVLTPRLPQGDVDVPAFTALLRFLKGQGIQRFAVNGATGEFCLTTPLQLEVILETAGRVCAGDPILCGVGAASATQSVRLADLAERSGVQGLLLPMPYFFPYSQQDLFAFSREVATSTRLPTLLYNLPQFTTGLEAETVCDLIESTPQIAGVKDSSGSLDILRALRDRLPAARRMIGNDAALAPALREGLCDGVVSGVACVLPEMVSELYASDPRGAEFAKIAHKLEAFIEQLNELPTPWGLKWAAEARGIIQAHFSLPLSPERQRQGEELKQWFRAFKLEPVAV